MYDLRVREIEKVLVPLETGTKPLSVSVEQKDVILSLSVKRIL